MKETSRLHGISTKGELSQLAVLLHELVLQVTWKKHAGSIIPKKRSSSPQCNLAIFQEIERLLAEETIVELRVASGGTAPPLLLDVAYIEALPRDHLTRLEEREVVFFCKRRLLKFSTRKCCQAQSQEEERRIPSPDSTQCHVAVDATKNTRRMESAGNKEMMESCSRTNHGLIDSGRRANSNQEVVESRQTLSSCPTSSYNWHQPDFSA